MRIFQAFVTTSRSLGFPSREGALVFLFEMYDSQRLFGAVVIPCAEPPVERKGCCVRRQKLITESTEECV